MPKRNPFDALVKAEAGKLQSMRARLLDQAYRMMATQTELDSSIYKCFDEVSSDIQHARLALEVASRALDRAQTALEKMLG